MKARRSYAQVAFLGIFVLGCTHANFMRIDKPFTGIEAALPQAPTGTLRVLAIHGIGCHLPGWSRSLQEGIAENLGLHENTTLRARIDLDVDQKRIVDWSQGSYLPVEPWRNGCAELSSKGANAPDSPPTISIRVWEAPNASTVAFYEVVWSPVAEKAKFEELQDDYRRSSRGPRAVINRWLKSSLVNERLADVSVYLGSRRDSIQWVAQQALCLMSGGLGTQPQVGSSLCPIDTASIARDPVIAITESLGSRILFDTLWAPSLRIDELDLLSRLRTVFMLANQLPLLEVASGGKEARNTYASLSADMPGPKFSAWFDSIEPGSDCSIDMALAEMEADGKSWEKDVEAKLNPRENAAEVRRCQAGLDQASEALKKKESEKEDLANRIAMEEERRRSLDQQLEDATRDLHALLNFELASTETEVAERRGREKLARDALQDSHNKLLQNQRAQYAVKVDMENARNGVRGLVDRLVRFSDAMDNVQTKLVSYAEFAKGDDEHVARARSALSTAWTHLGRAGVLMKQALDDDGGIQARLAEILDPSTRTAMDNLKLEGKSCPWYSTCREKREAREDLIAALDELSHAGTPSEAEIRAYRESLEGALKKLSNLQAAESDLAKAESSLFAEWNSHEQARVRAEVAKDDVKRQIMKATTLADKLKEGIQSSDSTHEQLDESLKAKVRELEAQSGQVANLQKELQFWRARAEEEALAGIYAFKLTLRKSRRAQLEARKRMVTSKLERAEQGSSVLDQARAQCLRALGDRLGVMVQATQPQPQFVAMSDPNDVLSYPVGTKLADEYVTDFSNVLLRLAPEFMWVASNPLRAHTGHESNRSAMQLITCGTHQSTMGRLVPADCRSGQQPEPPANSASTRSGITPASKARSRRSWTARRPASP